MDRSSKWIGMAATMCLVAACGGEQGDANGEPNRNVVEVVARGLAFEAPDEIPSGWTTFRFQNASAVTHFALVERMPEGKGVADQQRDIAPVFQEGLDLLDAGEMDAAMAKFGDLPEWFGEVVFMGGPGLTAPGHASEASVYLEPGTYLLECYVKTNGIFHSYNPDTAVYGMVHEFRVTREPSGGTEPSADVAVTLSSARGIEVTGELTAGSRTVSVQFEDQTVHENFVGHDLHVARLPDDVAVDEVAAWMNWAVPGGLETPAPVEFIGGTNEMPADATAYFTVRLEPGRYAWVSEVTNPQEKDMLQEFTVAVEE